MGITPTNTASREARSETDAIVRLEGLTRRYGDLVAVDDLSLEIRRGEILGLLGPNGAGKTTTINMLCGLLKPTSGNIVFDMEVEGEARRPAIGLCPQDLMLWETLTCLEQLVFMAEMYDVPRRRARRRALELLEVMGLDEKRNKLAKTLSGGMQRRLNIILALVHEPAIVVLDEPQAGLDPQSRVLVRDYIRSLKNYTTVVLTTHDMEEADKLSDRVAVVDRGRLLVLDTPANLKRSLGREEVLEVELAETGRVEALAEGLAADGSAVARKDGILSIATDDIIGGIRRVMDLAGAAGIEIEDLRVRRRSLEDVFMALTGRGLRE
jgi:ABC-2 type transport system ATP-binding protein